MLVSLSIHWQRGVFSDRSPSFIFVSQCFFSCFFLVLLILIFIRISSPHAKLIDSAWEICSRFPCFRAYQICGFLLFFIFFKGVLLTLCDSCGCCCCFEQVKCLCATIPTYVYTRDVFEVRPGHKGIFDSDAAAWLDYPVIIPPFPALPLLVRFLLTRFLISLLHSFFLKNTTCS